jgi:DNA-binding transcriptional LysR family regulator
LTLSDLKNEKWIEVGKPINPVLDQIESACQEVGFSRENAIIQMVTSLELMYSLVSLGIGIAFAPSFIYLSKEPNLVLKPLFNADKSPFKAIQVSIGLAYRSDNASPLVIALSGLVIEV